MAKIPELSDLFLAAADIEAETPITIGVNRVGPDGYFINLQPVKPRAEGRPGRSGRAPLMNEPLTPRQRKMIGAALARIAMKTPAGSDWAYEVLDLASKLGCIEEFRIFERLAAMRRRRGDHWRRAGRPRQIFTLENGTLTWIDVPAEAQS